MKTVKLNSSHPEPASRTGRLGSGPPSNCNDLTDSRHPSADEAGVRDDGHWQGRHRDQVESSGCIFQACLLALFVISLLALVCQ